MKKYILLAVLLFSNLCWASSGWIMKSMLGYQVNKAHPLAPTAGWLFNEGSGGQVFDLSGNGKNGIATGTTSRITWQPGPEGSVVDFAGDLLAAFVFPAITFLSTDPWTIHVRCQTDGEITGSMLLGVYGTTNDYFWFREGGYLRFKGSGEAYADFALSSFTSWTTYSFVAKGDGNLHLFVNGVFNETIVVDTAFAIDSIGSAYVQDSYAFDGRVSSLNIYNRALTGGKIALLYREPFCMFEPSFDLTLYGGVAAPPVGGQIIMIQMTAIPLVLIFGFVILIRQKKKTA